MKLFVVSVFIILMVLLFSFAGAFSYKVMKEKLDDGSKH